MLQDNFSQQKQDVLLRIDKSSKQSWDKKIIRLCERINKNNNYYTTSSCSGRVVIMLDKEKKGKGLFIKIYHDLINLKKLKNDLDKIASFHSVINNKQLMKNSNINNINNKQLIKSKNLARGNIIKFKQEPCILHVACKTLKDAQNLYDKAKLAGWKKSGIIASGRRFMVELYNTGKLEFPIIKGNKILVDDNFLKIIVKKNNENLKKSWGKIEKLRRLI